MATKKQQKKSGRKATQATAKETPAMARKPNANTSAAIAPAPETEENEYVTDQLGELVNLPLEQIDFDSFQNCRTGDWDLAKSSEADPGTPFEDLMASIEMNGQKDPITVRRKPGNRNRIPFECVKGFRRGKAVRELASKHNVKNPTIKAIIKDLDDLAAHEENVFENTARENLSGPDLAFAAHNLMMRYQAAGVPITINQLAKRMGKNQSYLNKLIGIVSQAPDLANEWRKEKVTIGYKQMADVAALPANEQKAGYEAVKAGKPIPGSRDKGPRQVTAPEKKAENAIKREASLLGRLVALGHIRFKAAWTPELIRVLDAEAGQLPAGEQAKLATFGATTFETARKGLIEARKKDPKAEMVSEETEETSEEKEVLESATN